MHLTDYPYTHIAAQHAEIMWRDGSSVRLHTVHDVALDGSLRPPQIFTRALPDVPDWWHIFDLRQVAPILADEMPHCPPRDLQGLVFYTLRLQYRSAAEFRRAVAHAQPWTVPMRPHGAHQHAQPTLPKKAA